MQQEQDRLKEMHQTQVNNNQDLNRSLRVSQQELSVTALHLLQQNELLEKLNQELSALKQEGDAKKVREKIGEINKQIAAHTNSEATWGYVKQQFEQIHPDFFEHLLELNPDLSPKDLRLSTYLRMNMSTKEIARMTNYSVRGVESMRYRLRKKLNIPSETDLNIWMIQQ